MANFEIMAKTIVRVRKRLGLSMEAAAELAGLDITTARKIERGEQASLRTLGRYLDVIGLELVAREVRRG